MLSGTLRPVQEIVGPPILLSYLHPNFYLCIRANEQAGMLALLERIQNWNGTLAGDLKFVNNWTYITNGLPFFKDSILLPLIQWRRSFYPSRSAHDNGPLRRRLVCC